MYRLFDEYSGDCPREGTTLLHIASRYSLIDLLLAILENLDNVGVEADSKDADGRTPMSRAAAGGHETVVKLLLARDDVDADSKDADGQTPLSSTQRLRSACLPSKQLDAWRDSLPRGFRLSEVYNCRPRSTCFTSFTFISAIMRL